MDERKVTNTDMTPDGVLVTFGDGFTFLFQSNFLFGARLKSGQLMDSETVAAKAV